MACRRYVELVTQCSCNDGLETLPSWEITAAMCKFSCKDYSPSPPPPSPLPGLPPLPPTQFHHYIVEDALTWAAARDHCEDLGGRLALPSSAVALAALRAKASSDVWVSASDRLVEGCWRTGTAACELGGVRHLYGIYTVLPLPLPTFGGKTSLMLWARINKQLYDAPLLSAADFQARV